MSGICEDCNLPVAECECDWIGVRAALSMAQHGAQLKERIEKLERENARLKAIVDQVDDVLITSWITAKDDDYRKALNELMSFAVDANQYFVDAEVRDENAELRKDKERLDWALTDGVEVGWEDGGPIFAFDRDAIDAAMSRLTK